MINLAGTQRIPEHGPKTNQARRLSEVLTIPTPSRTARCTIALFMYRFSDPRGEPSRHPSHWQSQMRHGPNRYTPPLIQCPKHQQTISICQHGMWAGREPRRGDPCGRPRRSCRLPRQRDGTTPPDGSHAPARGRTRRLAPAPTAPGLRALQRYFVPFQGADSSARPLRPLFPARRRNWCRNSQEKSPSGPPPGSVARLNPHAPGTVSTCVAEPCRPTGRGNSPGDRS